MPGQERQWKAEAFRAVCRQFAGEGRRLNLTVIGDSEMEMGAARAIRQEFEHVLVKTVKLQELPSPEDLSKELAVVSQKGDPGIAPRAVDQPRQEVVRQGRVPPPEAHRGLRLSAAPERPTPSGGGGAEGAAVQLSAGPTAAAVPGGTARGPSVWVGSAKGCSGGLCQETPCLPPGCPGSG
ncbi:unnamed protein product, partial [Prorocentrum cordatum]